MGFFWDPPIQKFGTRVVKTPWFVVPKGAFCLQIGGKLREASGSTAMSKEASKNRRRQHGATNKKNITDIAANIVHVIKAR